MVQTNTAGMRTVFYMNTFMLTFASERPCLDDVHARAVPCYRFIDRHSQFPQKER